MSKLLIKNALLVAAMDAARTKIPGGEVLIEDNVIKAVGKNLLDNERPPSAGAPKSGDIKIIDASGCVVLPGFVNTHHHLYQTLTRNIAAVQDAKLFDWLVHLYEIWARLDPEVVRVSAQLGLAELLLTGCTTSTDQFYVFPEGQPTDLIDRQVEAAREIGMRFQPCHGSMSRGKSKGGLPPDRVVQDEAAILKESERLISKHHDPSPRAMTRISLAPCSPFSVTSELLKETAKLARAKKVRIHTHLAETLDEEQFCIDMHGLKPLAYMEKVGWTGSDVWYAHCVHMSDDEIKLMAETKTGVAHCPTSNLRLGSGIAPIRKMLDAGVPVSLAVDGSASNDTSDMLGELRQCLLAHRIKSGVGSMPAEDVFRMATRGGAAVLGRDDIGSLEPGRAADVAIFDMRQIGYAGALHDPLAALVFCGDSHIARTVIVNGKVVVDGGRLVTVDGDVLFAEADALSRKLIGS
ncbi:MAG: 8-oxoguanine deaminase [Endomicrobiia bacterium]|nr:8-oxoguanine deaminase [Endomicrobiia bacterium]